MNKSKPFFLNIAILLLSSLMVNSCSNKEKRAELEAYVKTTKSRAIKEIEPLPEVKPYETFTYKDSNLRSPFVPSTVEEVAKKLPNDNGIRPDVNRRKEPLEAFPLDTLRMVGTLEKDGKKWGIVVDKDGAIHRLAVGNYIGQNDGRIYEINEEKMLINEIVPDPNGGWRERKASLALVGDNAAPKKSK